MNMLATINTSTSPSSTMSSLEIANTEIHQSTNSGPFIILEKKGNQRLVRFLDTGNEQWYNVNSVRGKNLRDCMRPSLVGVGFKGVGPHLCNYTNEKGSRVQTREYRLWMGMMQRAYDGTRPTYSDVTVCERWHNFQNFCEDLPHLPNYSKWLSYKQGEISQPFELDKDGIIPGNLVYSPEACQFVTPLVNHSYVVRPVQPKRCTEEEIASIVLDQRTLHEIAKDYGISYQTVYRYKKKAGATTSRTYWSRQKK